MDLSVMTFNLRVDTSEDGVNAWPYRINRVTQVIKSNHPFIIGTQEGLYSMLEGLQRNLPQYGMIGNGRGGGKKGEHCAIFYNRNELELTNHGQFWLSLTPNEVNSVNWDSAYPRVCTWGAFHPLKNPSRKFLVFNTHLDHVSQEAREKGIRLIWTKMDVAIKKGYPVILTGDMNATPENKTIQFLRGENYIEEQTADLIDAYTVLNHSPGATSHHFQGQVDGGPIDYIYTSEDVKVLKTKIDRSVFDDHYPSDHYPVITELSI